MNLADSLKFVFQNKIQSILFDFIKTDLRKIFNEAKESISLKDFGPDKIQEIFYDFVALAKEIPTRLPKGLKQFHEEFLLELETCSDPKQKSLFTLKVLGALAFILINFQSNNTAALGLLRIQKKSKLARGAILLILINLLMHLSTKIISAVEDNLDDQVEKDKLSYIKAALSHPDASTNGLESPTVTDKSFLIVRNFINFMLIGE